MWKVFKGKSLKASIGNAGTYPKSALCQMRVESLEENFKIKKIYWKLLTTYVEWNRNVFLEFINLDLLHVPKLQSSHLI